VTTILPNVCLSCQHLDRSGPLAPRCSAFTRIPADIWLGESDHLEPRAGDHGITFLLDPELTVLHEMWQRRAERSHAT